MSKRSKKNTRSEIRGLKAGIYKGDDNSLTWKISRNDYGICIEFADHIAGLFYSMRIADRNKTTFDWGLLDDINMQDHKKQNNLEDTDEQGDE